MNLMYPRGRLRGNDGRIHRVEGDRYHGWAIWDNYKTQHFNRANEPDLQSPTLYYASEKPWKYQQLMHKLAVDTVVQYYFNGNSRGIGAHIDCIYKNDPKAFVRTILGSNSGSGMVEDQSACQSHKFFACKAIGQVLLW